MLNAFTVDVEDYFQVSGFEKQVARADWPSFESRVATNTQRILELLDQHAVRGTFFVLGWVADQVPELVKAIAQAGHEIGSHSYWHHLVYGLTPGEFREDLQRSCEALERLTGSPVRAFRAPSFSISEESRWAFDVLAECGITIDSSVFPTSLNDRYGMANAPLEPHEIATPHGTILECPMSTVRLAGKNIPVSGGGYFRLYPYPLTRRAFHQLNRQGRPVVFYTHPWEIDPGQPRLRAGSRLGRFRHYVNLSRTLAKLDRLLSDFEFGTLSECLGQRGWAVATGAAATGAAATGAAATGMGASVRAASPTPTAIT